MSTAKTHIQEVITEVETLGYVFTDEYFDFWTVPASGSDEIYRMEAKTHDMGSLSGNPVSGSTDPVSGSTDQVEKKKSFDLWVAFKLAPASNRKMDFYDVLDAKEDLEDAVLKSSSSVQVKVVENTMSPVIKDYIIVKLTGEIIYRRNLA